MHIPLLLTYLHHKLIWVCLFTNVNIFRCSKLCVPKVLVRQPTYAISLNYSMF